MSQTLLIPIHVDALCLVQPQNVVDTMVDYSLLPYKYQGDTYGTGQNNLSEQILGPLFNQQLRLEAGIHLHWALPDGLTNGEHDETGTTFPQVPNRWLILRRGGNKGEQQWIVESDYLHPELDGSDSPPPNAINILIEPPDLATVDPSDADTYQYQRFRYMGRWSILADWNPNGDDEYADALTAIGTKATVPIFDEVKATFAAFYPNCYSVFGFHDEEYDTTAPPSGLQYDVIGWYDDSDNDCLKQFLAENPEQSNEQLLEALQDKFGWTIESESGTPEIPEATIYHSRITFAGTSRSAKSLSQPTIAVANSAPEAIAAYLAHDFNDDTNDTGETIRKNVQDTLEALQLSEKLESRKLDLDAKFREARHERGFGTENNGFLWFLMPQVNQQGGNGNSQPYHAIPTQLAQLLNELNDLQEAYNQAWLDIESLRRQLYSQWYYFTKSNPNFYNTVYETSVYPLRKAMTQAGELEFTKEEDGSTTVTAKTLPFDIVSRLDDTFSNEYFSGFITGIQDGIEGHFSSEYWGWVAWEFECCGVTLSQQPDVARIDRTADNFYEGAVWGISDGGKTYSVKVEGGIFTIYIPPDDNQIAFNLVNKLNELSDAIATHNGSSATQYNLRPFPSQKYWRANDPVVLLTGEAAKAGIRFGEDGRLREDDLLACTPIEFDVSTITDNIGSLLSLIEGLKPEAEEDSINFITWSEQPWNPFAFHWNVFNYPCRDMDSGKVQDYQPNQIIENYSLDRNAIDLKLKEGKESSFVSSGNTYQGFSILTPSVGGELTERLTTYLNEQLLPNYYFAQEIPNEEQTPDYLKEHLQEIKTWYQDTNSLDTEEKQAADPIFVALWAYEQMQTLDCQTQMIGGFNDSLLLAQPTLQLEIDDPITTSADVKLFNEQVRWVFGDSLQYKFLNGDIFNPIRSGAMSIKQLWLIDSFGQHQEIDTEGRSLVTTYQMKPPNTVDYQVLLPPRLAQPARLNFHWLAADDLQQVEMTKIPAKTPICGWILPNNLDSNLAIYNHLGKSLGAIDLAGNWRNAPGVTIERDGNNYPLLANHHLRKLVHYLLDQGTDFQQQFLSTLDNSLETIDPESFAEHTSLALLIGRPIAVVRANFSLEVKGLPACDPTVAVGSINDELENLDPPQQVNYGFTEVTIPIRLGDYQQLNDGLVGYWKETPVGDQGDYEYEGNTFYATQSGLEEDNLIQTEAEGIQHFLQAVDSVPQGVTMLLDPRGVVHVTSGVLPNQELRLPSAIYSQALQRMEVNFLSSPVLSDREEIFVMPVSQELDGSQESAPVWSIAIPVSVEPNSVWSWVSLAGEEWTDTTEVSPVNVKASFSKSQEAFEGWLQLSRVEETTEGS